MTIPSSGIQGPAKSSDSIQRSWRGRIGANYFRNFLGQAAVGRCRSPWTYVLFPICRVVLCGGWRHRVHVVKIPPSWSCRCSWGGCSLSLFHGGQHFFTAGGHYTYWVAKSPLPRLSSLMLLICWSGFCWFIVSFCSVLSCWSPCRLSFFSVLPYCHHHFNLSVPFAWFLLLLKLV